MTARRASHILKEEFGATRVVAFDSLAHGAWYGSCSDVDLAVEDEYRKFRHRIRNIYTSNLDPERMAPLVLHLSTLWPQIRSELKLFAQFLRGLASADVD